MPGFSNGSVRRPGYGAVCPQAIEAIEATKIKMLVDEAVEYLIALLKR
jgi:hypothetical protein